MALADEEFATVAQGAVVGLIGSVVLITLWLFLAVQTWRLIVPILATLGLGLMLTLLFAAVAVGTLNLVSVGFGILFVGIAVDFAIQFSVRYRERRFEYPDPAEAMRQNARRAPATQILVAAIATSAGFLAFVPTAFLRRGGARPDRRRRHADRLRSARWASCPRRSRCAARAARRRWSASPGRRRSIRSLRGIAGRSWPCSPRWRCWRSRSRRAWQFDSDPLHTKNPNTEAMRTLRDLMDNPLTNPYSIDILATERGGTPTRWRRSWCKLPTVSKVIDIESFVPDDQQAKLAHHRRCQFDPGADAGCRTHRRRRSRRSRCGWRRRPRWRRSSRRWRSCRPDHPLAAIAGDLRQLQAAPDDDCCWRPNAR